jgi:hypothetical protein
MGSQEKLSTGWESGIRLNQSFKCRAADINPGPRLGNRNRLKATLSKKCSVIAIPV